MIDVNTASFATLLINFVTAIAVGVSFGVERAVNIKETRRMAGLRDFVLIAILSFVASLYYKLVPLAWLFAFAATIGFAISSFVLRSVLSDQDKPVGLTTLLSLPITFLIASLPNFGAPFWIVATIVFVALLVLGLKVKIYEVAGTIEKSEVIDFAVLLAIAVSVTPLIPPMARLPIPLVDFSGEEAQIVYRYIALPALWKVVVMVSLMTFIAHFVTKYITGKNALAIAAFLGGLVSSLATMIMLLHSHEHRAQDDGSGLTTNMKLNRDQLFLGFIAANTGSILKSIVILRITVGYEIFSQFLLSLVSGLLLFCTIGVYTYMSHTKDAKPIRISHRALPLRFIFQFSTILALLIVVMTVVTYYMGSAALVPVSFLSSLVNSTATITSIGATILQNSDVNIWTVGLAIIASLMASAIAKYIVIVRQTGFRDSVVFILPILSLGIVTMATLWISLAGHGE